nr:putative ribonuclease H-like domain-containing protein [Tanacetum cinerariifolium]
MEWDRTGVIWQMMKKIMHWLLMKKKLETLKEEKERVDGKLAGLLKASKDLDNLIESQRSDKIKDGLGYSVVPPPPAQLYLSPKKDLSWTGLPECADDRVTDYSRPSPTVKSTSGDDQNRNPSVFETVASPITLIPFIKFVMLKDNQSKSKTGKTESPKKPPVKYAEQYRKPNKKPNVRRNQRNWNNLKTHQLGPDFVMKKKACFNFGEFNHLAYDCRKRGSSQNNIDDKGYWDSGCSRHMTWNISYLSYYEPFDRGYVSFGQGGCKITGKGTIKTGKLEFENVYFVKHLKYNLFSVSHIYDNKNSVLFTDSECIVLGRDFKLLDDANILLRTPRQHNMYSIDLNNIVPHRDLTCLVAKASADECMLWHRRLCHLNFKTMNKLIRHNLVRGLLSKCFENDHTCTACLKGKQHKASCKSKLLNSVTKPLHTLHIDSFGPTTVSSISHKWYCLVVTDDFSKFTWTFFLKSKDETSGILKKFITEIENLKDLKVEIIRCDNRGEFRNKEMNDFCSQKGIKREFSNAKTPQQNGVAERRNRTLIEAARTMLADAKLPVTFWAEAVNTACYVQNRVLVNKPHDKTPYELFNDRSPAIGFLKPFGCHVMILNTLDNLGKFEEKGDEGYFIGYSMSSKAFRVFNKRTRRVEENLHVEFLENKAIEKGAGPNWLFDIDSLTKSMNYVPVDVDTISTNLSGTKDAVSQEVKKNVSSLRYIALPNWAHDALLEYSSSKPPNHCSIEVPEGSGNLNPTTSTSNPPADPMETLTAKTSIPTASSPVPTAYSTDSQESPSDARLISKRVANQVETPSLNNILSLTNQFEDIFEVSSNSEESNGVEADISSMETANTASPTPTLRIYKDHPKSQIIGPMDTLIQTRNKSKEIYDALQDPSWVEAMQEDLLQFKIQKRTLVDCPKGASSSRGPQEEGIDYDEVFIPVARIEAIRFFLAYASFMGFTVYQMDVKSAFFYGTIDEEVLLEPGMKEDGIFLSQDKYVGDILKKFRYSDVRSSNTPMDKENPWGKDGIGKDVDLHLYRSMIGSLMYLTASRPDIMFAVCAYARHQVTPKKCHLHAVKRIFRYLKRHPKLGLWYLKESPFDLVAYSDSDYGGAT